MSTELIVLEDVKIEPFFIGGKGIDSILAEIESKAMEHVPDVSTLKGRNAIKANVTKVTTCKTFLEASGKDLSAKRKLEPKLIDANRKRVKEFLEALQVMARLKLTEWETEQAQIKLEAEEKAAADARIELHDTYYEAAAILMAEDFRQRAAVIEQARLDQIARDDAIALEATQKAEREAQAAIDKAEADKQAAIVAAKAAEDKAKQDKIDADKREEQYKINAEIFAEQSRQQVLADKIAAEKKAEADRQQAIINEQNRVAAEQKQIEADTAKREANTKHKGKIHRTILAAMVDGGLDENTAKGLIGNMSKGLIPYVSINY